MKHMTVCAKRQDRKAILEMLQRTEAVEIISREDDVNDPVFSRIDVSQSSQLFTKNAAQADKALEILSAAAPEKTSLLSALTLPRTSLTPILCSPDFSTAESTVRHRSPGLRMS